MDGPRGTDRIDAPEPATESRLDHDWWSGELRPGQSAELDVAERTVVGQLSTFGGGVIELLLHPSQRDACPPGPAIAGRISISIEGGSVVAPVSCTLVDAGLRAQVTGPVMLMQRRRHRRVAIRLPVQVEWNDHVTGERHRSTTWSIDLSAGGVRLEPLGSGRPHLQAPVELTIACRNGSVGVPAQLIGTAGTGLRFAFRSVPAEAGALLRLTVEQAARRAGGRPLRDLGPGTYGPTPRSAVDAAGRSSHGRGTASDSGAGPRISTSTPTEGRS